MQSQGLRNVIGSELYAQGTKHGVRSMKPRKNSSSARLARLLKDQRGQALPIVAFLLVLLLGFAGLVLDFGHCYLCFRELQASADAAALAGAGNLPKSTATATATSYSATSGSQNAQGNLAGVTMVSGYPLLKCLSTLTAQGLACVSPANANAVQVKEQVRVPLTFARLFGTTSATITATATAAMRGSSRSPYNVAIVLDTTASMGSLDSDSNCNTSRISCALSGVQTLMSNLSPCGASQSTCGTATNGDVANSVDRISLFVFPGLTSPTQAQYDYDCSSSTTPAISTYSYPTLPTYQVIPFNSDYRVSDTSLSLNTSSNLVIAAGGKASCTGIQAPGGEGTYYAGVIYAAQAALVTAQAANTGTQNVMIILSDGDANATSSHMSSTNSKGTYPSTVDQCHQAITAAQAASTAGTRVYTVAYGAEASGCSTDSPTITPCQTMQQMASMASTFYSDYTATGGDSTCISASQPTTSLNQIFTEIAGDLSVPRLIPDNTP